MAAAYRAVASTTARPVRPAFGRASSLEGLHRCIRRSPRVKASITLRPLGRSLAQAEVPVPGTSMGNDLRLFAMTFIAGFIFVSILIG
ncbi:MAG: hypothetical protein ABIO69_02265 [Sphingomicrobium sp.]